MFYLLVLIFVFYFVLTLASIVAVLQENILYSKKDKFQKVLFILLVPVIASIVELLKLSKYKKLKNDKYEDNVNRNARVYKFFDDHTPDIPVNNPDSVL